MCGREAAQLQFLDKQLLCLLKEICEGSATNVKRFASNTAAVLAVRKEEEEGDGGGGDLMILFPQVLHVLRRCRMINHQSSSWRASELDVVQERSWSVLPLTYSRSWKRSEASRRSFSPTASWRMRTGRAWKTPARGST